MKSKKVAPVKKAAVSPRARRSARTLKASESASDSAPKTGKPPAARKPAARKTRAAKSATRASKPAVRKSRKKVAAVNAPAPAEAPVKSPRRRAIKPRAPGGVSRRKAIQVPAPSVPAIPNAPAAALPEPQRIPSILLEDDRPTIETSSGPGLRYSLGPTPPTPRALAPEADLPESYGTRELLLAARDPHWLYAHWDLSMDEQRHYNALSADRHLVLRIFLEAPEGRPFTEVHLHPESRHWFIHVGRGGTRFVCELGYYSRDGNWTSISVSSPTMTPADSTSRETAAEFVTLPYELPLSKVVSIVKESVRDHPPLARAIEELRVQGHPELPRLGTPATPAPWTPAQEQALAQILRMDHVRRVWIGSLEITGLIRQEHAHELASLAAAASATPTSPAGGPGNLSSPMGSAWGPGGFWFNVNAELIIYGATEPDATVTLGGRPIPLRPDGTFSFRFSLPDGEYDLPVVAVSSDQTDGRGVELQFSRRTEYHGEVGAHPQDATLNSPAPEHV